MTEGSPAILAEGLRKSCGETRALDGLDLSVEEGTVLGLLGPNGAGKTTAVRILTTLLAPDAGRAEVAGLEVVRQAGRRPRGLGCRVIRSRSRNPAWFRRLALVLRLLGSLCLHVFLGALRRVSRMRGGPVSRLLRRSFAGVRPVGALCFHVFFAAFGGFLGVLRSLFAHPDLLGAWVFGRFIPS